jgi:hypothetical protein
MENREKAVVELRPVLELHVEQSSELEKFQNITLRPILKFQHLVFVALFRHYIKKRKNTFYGMNVSDKLLFVNKSIKQDITLKNSMVGMVIGLFTLEEIEFYQENDGEVSRRISTMLVQRLQSVIEAL